MARWKLCARPSPVWGSRSRQRARLAETDPPPRLALRIWASRRGHVGGEFPRRAVGGCSVLEVDLHGAAMRCWSLLYSFIASVAFARRSSSLPMR